MKLLPAATLAAALSISTLSATAAPPTVKTVATPNPILANAKSYSVTETDLRPNAQNILAVVGTSEFQYQQGNKFHVALHSATDKTMNSATLVSDGKNVYAFLPAKAQYFKTGLGSDPATQERHSLETLPAGKPARTTIDGKPALLYQQFSPASGKPQTVTKTWLDASTHLPLRQDIVVLAGKAPKLADRTVYSNWKINPTIPAAQFVFVPPAGVKELVAQAPPVEPTLLANGTAAPDFAVQDKDGKPVHLSDYKGKVIVLDFWATWCGPCQASLPHTQSVAAQFAPQGVVVLAVNVWDKHDAYEQWLPQHAAYKDIAFAFDPSDGSKAVTDAYHVSGIPTQYVVDKDGKITQSFVGYDGPSDALSNAITSALKG